MDEASNYAAIMRHYRSAELHQPQAIRNVNLVVAGAPQCASAPPTQPHLMRERSPTWISQRDVHIEIPEERRLAIERQRLRDELREDLVESRQEEVTIRTAEFQRPPPISSWSIVVGIITLWAPDELLESVGGMTDPERKRAWREKMAFCQLVSWLSWVILSTAYWLGTADCSGMGFMIEMDTQCILSYSVLGGFSLLFIFGGLLKFVVVAYYKFYRPTRLFASGEHTQKPLIIYIPCDEEDLESIRQTCDSLASAEYQDMARVIVLVFDGQSTASMFLHDALLGEITSSRQTRCYVSLSHGTYRPNRAYVNSGMYKGKTYSIPMVLVVKCGAQGDDNGHRGRQDSLHLLLNAISSVYSDERITECDYEILSAIEQVTGVKITDFEYLLAINVGTKVKINTLMRMVGCMEDNPDVMALCNSLQSSRMKPSLHFFNKILTQYGRYFESVMGKATIWSSGPSIWRIRSSVGELVPILVDPFIVGFVADSSICTLHQGISQADEFLDLSVLMQQQFPGYKLPSIPTALAPAEWVEKGPGPIMSLRCQLTDLRTSIRRKGRILNRFYSLISLLCIMARPSMTVTFIFAIYLLIATWPTVAWPAILLVVMSTAFLFLPLVLALIVEPSLTSLKSMITFILTIPYHFCYIPLLSFWSLDADFCQKPMTESDSTWREELIALERKRRPQWDLELRTRLRSQAQVDSSQ
jgi:hypothetical protein